MFKSAIDCPNPAVCPESMQATSPWDAPSRRERLNVVPVALRDSPSRNATTSISPSASAGISIAAR